MLPTAPTPLQSPASPATDTQTVDAFHEIFYYRRLWDTTTWMGVKVYKCPFDLWIYQEIICAERPDVVIETGTAAGGSALFMAHVQDQVGAGRIVSIDVAPQVRPVHPRIRYMEGSSIDPAVVSAVRSEILPSERVLVILDSLHNRDHVLEELRVWSPLVAPSGRIIVEDTNINGHPVHTDYPPDQGPGAWEAVEAFLAENSDFEVDHAAERLLLTFNPRGYLRRKGS